jgi:hypothetical protein
MFRRSKKYLVSFLFTDETGHGFGQAPIILSGRIRPGDIVGAIKSQTNLDNIVILNILKYRQWSRKDRSEKLIAIEEKRFYAEEKQNE